MLIKLNLFMLIFWLFSFSMAQKNEVYLNDDLVQISESEFKKMNDLHKFYNLQYETDSSFINIKVQRVRKGKLSGEVWNAIKSELSALSNQEIPENDLIIINYYHGMDGCNSSGNKSHMTAKYKRFLKGINKMPDLSQFFVFKSAEGTTNYGKNINWIHDKSRRIEKTFFPLKYPCGSYVLIDENGNYYLQKGEYDIEQIIDLVKNKKTTFATINSSY